MRRADFRKLVKLGSLKEQFLKGMQELLLNYEGRIAPLLHCPLCEVADLACDMAYTELELGVGHHCECCVWMYFTPADCDINFSADGHVIGRSDIYNTVPYARKHPEEHTYWAGVRKRQLRAWIKAMRSWK